ncbi:hypothetical protein H0H93_008612 [Arthromyces matolae]|nr:hypothetical protein H0H93_008612 [Arthromyces matolae]
MLGFTDNSTVTGTMRLAPEDNQAVHRNNTRKRKSPPITNEIHHPHVLPPMIHPLPPGYPYPDFTPGGLPPPPPPPQQQQPPQDQPSPTSAAAAAANPRPLSNSKRAEQNRKAQRAFRERRDQHVKTLESRSQLLDAALASADEANRRWEECRALVDQLRVENAALRAALSQSQLSGPITAPIPPQQQLTDNHSHQQQIEEATRSLEAVVSDSLKNESTNDPRNDKSD